MFPLRVVDIIINIKSKRLIGPINLQIEQDGITTVSYTHLRAHET